MGIDGGEEEYGGEAMRNVRVRETAATPTRERGRPEKAFPWQGRRETGHPEEEVIDRVLGHEGGEDPPVRQGKGPEE